MNKKAYGFTIVELLIVIVVIGILAAISIVAYNNVQQKARDSQRAQDIRTIAKALEMYYTDYGEFPNSACGASCPPGKKGGTTVATTADGSWSVLEDALVPDYISALPKDPQASTDKDPGYTGATNYDYLRWVPSTCSTVTTKTYVLVYRLESRTQTRDVTGSCPAGGNSNDYANASEYIVLKP